MLKFIILNILFSFKKNEKNVKILINFKSEINLIIFTFTTRLSFIKKIFNINIGKIDISYLKTYK